MDDRGDQRPPPEVLLALLHIRAVVQEPFKQLGQVSVDARVQRGWNPIDSVQLIGMVGDDSLRQRLILGC